MSSAIILFAHGARDPEWALPFATIATLVRAQRPDTPVVLAFLELMQPKLIDAVDALAQQGTQNITLIPMFLARGGHLKQDLPKLVDEIRARHPKLLFHIAPALGEVETILQQLSNWICSEHQTR
jgi:sirohydrochlorin cobaltochelatase